MQSDKKQWAQPRLQALGRSVFKNWRRDKLLRARELIVQGLQIVDARDDLPEEAAKLRVVLDELDAELAE